MAIAKGIFLNLADRTFTKHQSHSLSLVLQYNNRNLVKLEEVAKANLLLILLDEFEYLMSREEEEETH